MSTITEIAVPDIGDFKNIPVIEIPVKPGDIVRANDPLLTLETDKATMEAPAPTAGKVVELLVAIGAAVSRGSPILRLEASTASAIPAPASAPVAAPSAVARPAAAGVAARPPTPPKSMGPVHASPSVRAFARELGLDIARLVGSGPKGRILREDVLAFVNRVARPGATPGDGRVAGIDPLPWPAVDFAKFGEVERVPLSRLRKISGPNLARNWVLIPWSGPRS